MTRQGTRAAMIRKSVLCLSRRDLAHRAGIAESTLVRIEQGQYVKIDTIEMLCKGMSEGFTSTTITPRLLREATNIEFAEWFAKNCI